MYSMIGQLSDTRCTLQVTAVHEYMQRHSLLYFQLSHMAVHHLHHLHYHRLHLLLLAQYFILNSRLGCSANLFFPQTFFSYRTDSRDSRTI